MSEPADDLVVDPAQLFSDARAAKLTRQRELGEALTRSKPEAEADVRLDEFVDLVAEKVIQRLEERGAPWT